MTAIIGALLTAFVVIVALVVLVLSVGAASSSAGPVAAGIMLIFTLGALSELR